MLDRYNRLPYNYQSKTGYDTLIQNVILKELINIMRTKLTDIDVDLKIKTSGIKIKKNETKTHMNNQRNINISQI